MAELSRERIKKIRVGLEPVTLEDLMNLCSMALRSAEREGWVSVSERCPDEGQGCAWIPLSGSVFSGHYSNLNFHAPGKKYTRSVVMLWHPLPAAPRTDGEKR
jgi:hypothetical protein